MIDPCRGALQAETLHEIMGREQYKRAMLTTIKRISYLKCIYTLWYFAGKVTLAAKEKSLAAASETLINSMPWVEAEKLPGLLGIMARNYMRTATW